MYDTEEYGQDAEPVIIEASSDDSASMPTRWVPICRRSCDFDPSHFSEAMMNVITNPNLLSGWLFRADILQELGGIVACEGASSRPPSLAFEKQPEIPLVEGLRCTGIIVRKLIPRNTKRDNPLIQSCAFYGGAGVGEHDPITPSTDEALRSLVLYLPHASSADEMPFYHPKVRGVGFLHEWDMRHLRGSFSVHYHFFPAASRSLRSIDPKLRRTALNLMSILHKLGRGQLNGYVKRVHHDVLVPRPALQDRLASLRGTHARRLVSGWLEVTDPMKHVFEDLCIAAFLIELWADMYRDSTFPGFVDIGTGNGLLVHILNQEGFRGWGFDARTRKSWRGYNRKLKDGQDLLQQRVLVPCLLNTTQQLMDEPSMANGNSDPFGSTRGNHGDPEPTCHQDRLEKTGMTDGRVHDGLFPTGTFIIANHADELTPWTPILAARSGCPFMAIPCCSHNLAGAKFRAPPPRDKLKGASTYSSFVSWVSEIAADCGWAVETEILRMPSTRNTAIIGRDRNVQASEEDLQGVIEKYGGADGYRENVIKLLRTADHRGH